MTAHTIQDCGIPWILSFDEDFNTTKQRAARLETPPYNQLPAADCCGAMPDAAPVSPCPSDNPPALARSVTGKFSDIDDKYCVDSRVMGTGHHGSVRRCVGRATGMQYAVKSIYKGDSAAKLDSLAREVMLLKEVDHGSIVRLVDVFEDADHLHIVTELCAGGELFDKILEKSAEDNGTACFTEEEAAKIIHQIMMSVSYMHRIGIVHRDLKPENVLFESADEDSLIKIIDFGLSKRHLGGQEPPMNTVVGTPYYIAPEVLKKKYDKSCDLWSVGVIAYILLCGYPPFSGRNSKETHQAVLRGQYYFPRKDWEGVSVEARDFVRRLLKMDPRRRMTAKQALDHPWIAKHSNHYSVRLVEVEQRDDVSDAYIDCAGASRGTTLQTKGSIFNGRVKRRRARRSVLAI